jgi:hypothetical protein
LDNRANEIQDSFVEIQDLCASQQVKQSLTGLFQGGGDQPRSGDQNQVQVGSDVWEQGPHRFAEETFCSIAMNSGPYCPPSRNTDFDLRLIMSLNYQHNKRVGIGLARTPHPLEVFGSGQTKLSLHPLPRTRLN